MSEEDKYMDDRFREMSEGVTPTYHASFWNDALAQLENDALDEAFRNAASVNPIIPNMDLGLAALDDAFMDDAFVESAANFEVEYASDAWSEMQTNESDLIMDEAFSDASNKVVTTYNPIFWNDANSALEQEGLNHEYQAEYWDEARTLLDKEDRRLFFTNWTVAAIVLLLISFAGINSNFNSILAKTDRGNYKIHLKPISENTNRSETKLNSQNKVDATLNGGLKATEIEDQALQVANQLNSIGDETNSDLNASDINVNNEIQNADLKNHSRLDDSNLIPENSDLNAKIVSNNNANNQEDKLEDFKADYGFLSNHIEVPIRLIPTTKSEFSLSKQSLVEFESLKLKPVHSISAIGYVGLGQNYGENTFLYTKRFGGKLEYLFSNSGKLNNGNRGNFEFGGNIGINYIQCDGLGIENQVTKYKANGDVEKFWRNLQVFDLYYGNVTLFTNYKINNYHKFRFGVGVDHLLAVKSNMAYRMDDDKGIQTVNNNWGVKDGIRNFDAHVMIGYEFNINRKLAFQLNFTTGLVDRTNNDFFSDGIAVKDFERNLTLGLRYNLFNKL